MDEDISKWDLNKLRREHDQAWELAGCARRDRDKADEDRWTSKARMYAAEITKRIHT